MHENGIWGYYIFRVGGFGSGLESLLEFDLAQTRTSLASDLAHASPSALF